MPGKLQAYEQMSASVAERITQSYGEWTAFLTTAARLYKYPFQEQLLIYVQRPDATACADLGPLEQNNGPLYPARVNRHRPH